MSDSMVKHVWDEVNGRPLGDAGAEGHERVEWQRRQLRYALTGLVFSAAGVHLALAVATVTQGASSAPRLAGAVPALVAACLGVRGIRRSSFALCGSALGLMAAWSALIVLV